MILSFDPTFLTNQKYCSIKNKNESVLLLFYLSNSICYFCGIICTTEKVQKVLSWSGEDANFIRCGLFEGRVLLLAAAFFQFYFALVNYPRRQGSKFGEKYFSNAVQMANSHPINRKKEVFRFQNYLFPWFVCSFRLFVRALLCGLGWSGLRQYPKSACIHLPIFISILLIILNASERNGKNFHQYFF